MQYANLGKTGLKVSRLTMGCMSFGSSKWNGWALDQEESFKVLKEGHDLGFNFFDTADVYSNGESERILGRFLREYSIPRENVVIATKVHFGVDKSGEQRMTVTDPNVVYINARGLSRKHIMHAVEDSLERLQTDYIDLYIIHRWYKDFGWSQRESDLCVIAHNIYHLLSHIRDLCEQESRLPSDFVMDIYVGNDTLKVHPTKLNTPGAHMASESCLWHWIRDYQILHNSLGDKIEVGVSSLRTVNV